MKIENVPKPLAVTPSKRQLAWHDMEFYGFIHFTLNAWTDKEWGYGDESPSLFNPEKLDCAQWAEAAKAAGMKGLILTTKHHDGFCLFPSAHTGHSVKSSPWRNGKGDVVKEFVKACADAGLKAGFYLSPWDRNRHDYAAPSYVDYYRKQLHELLDGRYGQIFEFWLDGANGGDGYYGGANEKRKIDASTYYDWPVTIKMIRELQPGAVVFSDSGPDVRWVGNEGGECSETSWQTTTSALPFDTTPQFMPLGDVEGDVWRPPECDVSIRPGWFHHDFENEKVKSPEHLLDLYFKSVGRGASLLLNLPPAKDGLIHKNDIESLKGFRRLLDAGLAKDFAKGAKATASNTRAGDPAFAASSAIDGSKDGYWATDDGIVAATLTLELKESAKFNTVSLREKLEFGQRVMAFKVEALCDGVWRTVANGTSIGSRRLLKFRPVEAEAVRLCILDGKACPCVKEFALHLF